MFRSRVHRGPFPLFALTGLLVAAIVAPVALAASVQPATTNEAAPYLAGHGPFSAAAEPRNNSADLAGALGPDGTFVGASGVAGTVDQGAWTLVSDLAAGEPPRFAPAADAVLAPIAGPWSALGSDGSGNGALNGPVYAVAVSGRDLYVGGAFTNAGGIAGANFIARWNGSAWSAVGAPYDIFGQVQAIAISGTDVYIGGRFTDAGGIPTADYVAKWNGSTWSALGSNGSGDGAIGSWVQALATDGSNLDVGGWFTNAGGIATADYVSQWNGSTWSALGSNGSGNGAIESLPDAPSPVVFALAVSGTDLYVGGSFIDVAGIAEADAIAKWNGSAWSNLGSDFGNNGAILGPAGVYALAVSGTDLYVGGSFHDVNSLSADNVAKWNGSTWSPLGSDGLGDGAITHNVHALAVVGTDLYVGGEFYDAAGIATADRIARWDGATWNAMGSGGPDGGALNSEVDALTVSASGTDLYVGGMFDNAAGIATADYIALWGPPIVVRRPDGRIRLGGGAFAGNDIYNTTGAGQSRIGAAALGRSITFGISIQNDGTSVDRFKVKATGTARSAYTVKYFRGTTDVTAAVVAGTYRTSSLAPATTYLIKARVTVRSTAAVGSAVKRLVTIASIRDNTMKDAVTFIGKRS